MKAMILAAGFGARLRPLTHTLPKPMFPILNRPVLEHSIALLRRHGIGEITINLHHLPEKVTDYFGDGSRFGVRIHWSLEAAILGTAGGIKAAQRYLDGDSFVVINSDVVCDIDLSKVFEYHRSRASCLTLVLKEGDSPEACDPIETDDTGRIVHMVGQSSKNVPEFTRRFTFTGIQIVEPEIFERIPVGKFYGTTTDVFPEMIADGRPVFGYPHHGYWRDIGTPTSYLAVHRDALDGKINLPAADGSSSADHPAITSPACIGKGCRIAENARVGPYAVMGDGCLLAEGARVENSVLWSGVTVESNATVRNCILGHSVHVARGTHVSGEILPPFSPK